MESKIKVVMPKTDRENNIWRTGYDMGVKAIMKDNDIALKIGNAIMEALDNRYEFKEEDY